MPAFCHGTLQTGIERISREDGKEGRLASVFGMGSIVIHEGLKACCASDRLGRPRPKIAKDGDEKSVNM